MRTKLFKKADKKALAEMEKISGKIAKRNEHAQRKTIEESSPFSAEITKAFGGYDEYNYILSLGLREAQVTRRSLIRGYRNAAHKFGADAPGFISVYEG